MSISPEPVHPALPMATDEDSQDALRWYAIQSRSRHEKKVATQLQHKGVLAYLPLISETHRWSDRRKIVEQPLFPGYVFVRIDYSNEARIRVLRTLGVAGFVGSHGDGIPIPDKQIQDVQTLLASNAPFEPYPFLRLGRRVRIRGGCLEGIEGVLKAKNSDASVVVSVDLIQRSLAIRVCGFDLEPV